jgi:hypothetical protein
MVLCVNCRDSVMPGTCCLAIRFLESQLVFVFGHEEWSPVIYSVQIERVRKSRKSYISITFASPSKC